eukprot:TRINITY_DN1864_c0_g2_i6.p1 TRINITY_DN1864_c0_g2~~TRINITY_DN1864_c0_g2_i6.p1  ORF type:complete len:238 (-),score=27.94 TRINITY_DN1864_c0_g2_i6:10-723(-)
MVPIHSEAVVSTQSTGRRIPARTITRTIVHGSEANPLPQVTAQGFTHRWRCFVEGVAGEPLERWVSHVVFRLHPSFPDAERVVKSPPFEVTEEGWGEFEITISLYFVDAKQEPKELFHQLKLHRIQQKGRNRNSVNLSPLWSCFYADLTFTNLTQQMNGIFSLYPQTEDRPPLPGDTEVLSEVYSPEEKAGLDSLESAHKIIRMQIAQVVATYKRTVGEISLLKKELQEIEKESVVN